MIQRISVNNGHLYIIDVIHFKSSKSMKCLQ